jgi:O-antigen ligase
MPVAIGFLLAAFLMGGGARADILSLTLLRPISALTIGFAILSGFASDRRYDDRLPTLFLGMIAVGLLHLVPLPPSLWQSLPGRSFLAQIDEAAQLQNLWRPLTIDPQQTWNAVYALFVPLAMAMLLRGLTARDLRQLCLIVFAIALTSGVLGLLQILGGHGSVLYLYQTTNLGQAVGLFANRNHQAAFLACMLPLAPLVTDAVIGRLSRKRVAPQVRLAAITGLVTLLTLMILVTNSRLGLMLAAIGIASIPLIQARRRKERVAPQTRWRIVAFVGAMAIAGLVLASYLMRSTLFARMIDTSDNSELRILAWQPIFDMAMKYFPVGSGAGTFDTAYRLDEPSALLQRNYLNHAHNDWLEVVLTTGLPGLAFLLTLAIIWGLATARAWSRSADTDEAAAWRRSGSIILLMLAIGSFTDYPLRVPSLACFAVLMGAVLLQSRMGDTVGFEPRSGQPRAIAA